MLVGAGLLAMLEQLEQFLLEVLVTAMVKTRESDVASQYDTAAQLLGTSSRIGPEFSPAGPSVARDS